MEVANQNLTTVKLHPLPRVELAAVHIAVTFVPLLVCNSGVHHQVNECNGEDVQGGAKCKEGASVAVLKEMPNMGSITTLLGEAFCV
jgi:hypothetical protein